MSKENEVALPCPFCGSTNISEGEVLTVDRPLGTASQSMCRDCGALGAEAKLQDGEVDYGDAKATAAWNRRAAPDVQAMANDSALPELPRPRCTYADHSYPAFTADQMREYARAALAARSGDDATTMITAIDADMIWPEYDGETFFHSIDDAVEYEVDQARPTTGPLELKLSLGKRIPTATIRIFNITANGHEWEIVPAAATAASGGDLEVGS
jgi:Lar family restriction alleviation protein